MFLHFQAVAGVGVSERDGEEEDGCEKQEGVCHGVSPVERLRQVNGRWRLGFCKERIKKW